MLPIFAIESRKSSTAVIYYTIQFINTSNEINYMNKVPQEDMHLLEQVCQTIFDKKGFNTLTLDVRGQCTFTDYFIIAEGNVEKHVQTLAREIIDVLAEHQRSPIHVEGMRQGDWVLLDFSEVVIHLFIPDMRDRYQLEQLWRQAEIIDVPIHVGAR